MLGIGLAIIALLMVGVVLLDGPGNDAGTVKRLETPQTESSERPNAPATDSTETRDIPQTDTNERGER